MQLKTTDTEHFERCYGIPSSQTIPNNMLPLRDLQVETSVVKLKRKKRCRCYFCFVPYAIQADSIMVRGCKVRTPAHFRHLALFACIDSPFTALFSRAACKIANKSLPSQLIIEKLLTNFLWTPIARAAGPSLRPCPIAAVCRRKKTSRIRPSDLCRWVLQVGVCPRWTLISILASLSPHRSVYSVLTICGREYWNHHYDVAIKETWKRWKMKLP